MRPRRPARRAAGDLDQAIRQVVEEYRGFLAALPPGGEPPPNEDPKAFAARHAAARAALAHLELLLRLAGEQAPEAGAASDDATLLSAAKDELGRTDAGPEEAEDDGPSTDL